MDLDALLKSLIAAVGDNPTLVLILTIGFFFLKMLFPTPAPASSQVLASYAERIRLALQAGNPDGAKALAEEGVEKARGYVLAEAEPKPKGILDIFTGLFTGGNLLPLLMIGGVVLLLMLTQGGGCKKASGGALAPRSDRSQLTEPMLYVPAIFRDADRVAPTLCAADPFEWAEPMVAPGQSDGQAILGPDRRGDIPAYSGVSGPIAVCGAAGCSHWSRPSLASSGPARYRVGWTAGPRARPVARAARFVGRPVARAAVGIVRVVRWARPLRRAVAAIGWRRP
jgi:hypothetical protein